MNNPAKTVAYRLALLAVASIVRLPAEAPDASPPINGLAILRTWVPAEYPRAAQKDVINGAVQVRLVVDEKGAVTSSRVLDATDPMFASPALSAVNKWVFSPALDNSKPVPCSMDVSIIFSKDMLPRKARTAVLPPADQMPVASAVTEAALESSPDIDYPDSLFDRKLSGLAHYLCTVKPDGSVANPRITFATHVDFVLPALKAIGKLKYTPRMKGDLPTTAQVEGVLKFDLVPGSKAGALAANAISAPDGNPPAADVDPLVIVDPITPYGLALSGEKGSASVTFTVDQNGRPTDIRVHEASNPQFGDALVAAVQMCAFSPPTSGGQATTVVLVRKVQFPLASGQGDGGGDPLAPLLADMKAGKVPGAAGLDARLTPRYMASPAYPEALKSSGRPAGKALVEFIVGRDGRARFPQVVSASDPAFGWSAATAVSQWVFDIPRRAGQPVDVKVKVPFSFKSPSA